MPGGLRNTEEGTPLDIQWLRLRVSTAGGPDSIPCQGIKSHMPQLRPSTDKFKKKEEARVAGTEGDRAGGCRALGATTRTVSLPQVRRSQSRVLSCHQCPLDPSGFLWGDQGGCEEAPGTVQEGAEGRQGPVRLEGQGPGVCLAGGADSIPCGWTWV